MKQFILIVIHFGKFFGLFCFVSLFVFFLSFFLCFHWLYFTLLISSSSFCSFIGTGVILNKHIHKFSGGRLLHLSLCFGRSGEQFLPPFTLQAPIIIIQILLTGLHRLCLGHIGRTCLNIKIIHLWR